MAVVVGFIPTEVGFKALTAAREEAEQRGGPLIVVNVLREGVTDDPRHADDQQLEIARDELRRSSVRVAFRQETTDDDIADLLVQRIIDSIGNHRCHQMLVAKVLAHITARKQLG